MEPILPDLLIVHNIVHLFLQAQNFFATLFSEAVHPPVTDAILRLKIRQTVKQ